MIKGYSVSEGTEKIVNKCVSSDTLRPILLLLNQCHSTRRVEELAKKHNVSMAQVALAWVLARPGM